MLKWSFRGAGRRPWSMIHAEFSKFFRTEYFKDESIEQSGSLAKMRGIQQCFIIIQNRCVRATDELSHILALLKSYQDW